jgi:hypothetical protein
VSTSLAFRAGLTQKSAFADPRPRRALLSTATSAPNSFRKKNCHSQLCGKLRRRRITRPGALRRARTAGVLPSSHRFFLLFAGRQHARGGEVGACGSPIAAPVRHEEPVA